METHFPRSHYNPTHTEVTEHLEQEGTGCPWQTCSRDLLRSYNCRRELRESQSYTAWTGPEATGSTPCFGKPLLLIVLMALSPAVPKEQALLTWLCRGRESPTAPTFCCGCPGAQGQLSPGWAQTLSQNLHRGHQTAGGNAGTEMLAHIHSPLAAVRICMSGGPGPQSLAQTKATWF